MEKHDKNRSKSKKERIRGEGRSGECSYYRYHKILSETRIPEWRRKGEGNASHSHVGSSGSLASDT